MDRVDAGGSVNGISLEPRLLNRKDAAHYMGVSVRTFDKIKHLFGVELNGVVRYDRLDIDRHIELSKDRSAARNAD